MLESLFAAFFGLLFGSLGAVIVSMDMWLWGGIRNVYFHKFTVKQCITTKTLHVIANLTPFIHQLISDRW